MHLELKSFLWTRILNIEIRFDKSKYYMNYAKELFFERHLFRLLELKFREFKKQLVLLELKSGSVYLNTDSDLFTSMAEKIYELAIDESNGFLPNKKIIWIVRIIFIF